MKKLLACGVFFLASLFIVASAQAPQRLVPFSGSVATTTDVQTAGAATLVFSLYQDQAGGPPLWTETHTVALDAAGGYSVVLGSQTADGLPADAFAAGDARWLGVQANSDPEQPRMRLLAVPYAVAAGTAASLGGKTADDFVLATSLSDTVRDEIEKSATDGRDGSITNATVNAIPRFTTVGGAIDDSVMAQSGTNIGIGTTAANYPLQVNTAGNSLLQFTNAATGAAASDGVYFGVLTGDPTFRVMNQENGSIDFFTNGIRRLSIAGGGNIGIGTMNAGYPVQIHAAAGHSLLQFTNVVTGPGAGDGVYFGIVSGDNSFRVMNQENSGIDLFTNGLRRVTVTAAGNLGIGTAAPGYLMQVHAAAGHSLAQFTNAATGSGAGDGSYFGVVNGDTSFRVMNQEAAGIEMYTTGARRITVTAAGNVGIGTASPTTLLHVAGNTTVDGNIGAKYQDVAEWVEVSEPIEAGTIVVIDPDLDRYVRASGSAYQMTVAGAVSAQPGLILGEKGPNKVMVAQSGRVKIKVDAQYGAIKAGDLLVTSPTPGYAMRSQPTKVGGIAIHRPGTLLGKALEPMPRGKGEILALLTLQ